MGKHYFSAHTRRNNKLWLLCMIMFMQLAAFSSDKTNLELSELFSDNMVLQQNSSTPIWGWATPGTEIKVQTSWGQKAKTTTSKDGKWKLIFKTPRTNGKPQSLTVSTNDSTIVLNNVLLGEVWLCSGQSNMEMPVSGWLPNDPLLNSEKEIKEANYPAIRMFTVKRNKSFTPIETCEGTWEVCNPENVPNFSATAYFFGRKLHNELNVPIGLIHSSWSGSPAQSWVETDFVEKVEGFEDIKQKIAKATDKSSLYNKWLVTLKRRDQSNFIRSKEFNLVDKHFQGIMNQDYDDSKWDSVYTNTMDKVFERDNFNGMIWFRQEFIFDGDINSDDYQIYLGKVEDLNTTFINGIQVGRKENWGDNNKPQQYAIPKGVLKKGKNVLAVRVIDVWGTGGLLSQSSIKNKNGNVIQLLHNGWKYLPTAILLNEDFYVLNDGFNGIENPAKDQLVLNSHTPTVLYNAMIAPLIPYTIKGAIWYQGETNIANAKQYHTLFPAVFNSWRSKWRIGDFPFYYVQLASFNYGSNKVTELREAQFETLNKKNVGMAVTMDVGSATTIHPANKQDVGKRLALWALAKTYGKSNIVYSGPLYKSVTFSGSKAIVSFNQIGTGLYSPDSKLNFFEIAGSDKVFYTATAIIKDNKVIVQSNNVAVPKIVRFAWSDKAMPNFFNKEGLPASPFRTSKETKRGPDSLYPPKNMVIKYHNEWTKNHYANRIDLFKTEPLNDGDNVFLGNSITEGGQDWAGKFGITNIKNRGIGGDGTDGVLNRLDELIHFKPKAIFILIGINDLFNLHYQKEVPSAEYVGNNILKISKILSEKTPNTKIYVQTILPTDAEFMKEYISIVNAIIKANENKGKYKVIDLHTVFADTNDLMKKEFTYDGTHLNDAGYKVWVNFIKQYVDII